MNARTALERLFEATNHPYKGWYIYETGDGLVAVKHSVRIRAKTAELLHDVIDKRDHKFEAAMPAYMTVSFLGKHEYFPLGPGSRNGHTAIWGWIKQAFNVDDEATFIRQHAKDKVQLYASASDHEEYPLSELIEWVGYERGMRTESLCEAYTSIDFNTKADLKRALELGRRVSVYQPNDDITGHGAPTSGRVTLEGPHFPKPHRWYATAMVKDSYVVPGSVK